MVPILTRCSSVCIPSYPPPHIPLILLFILVYFTFFNVHSLVFSSHLSLQMQRTLGNAVESYLLQNNTLIEKNQV